MQRRDKVKIPTTLKHKPVITVENYENVDGRTAYDSDAKGLSLGLTLSATSTRSFFELYHRTVLPSKAFGFVFWNTKEIYFISSSGAISLTLMPPIKTFPSVASQKRGTRRAIVVFPPPEAPTRATVFPCGIVKLTSSTAFYLNLGIV